MKQLIILTIIVVSYSAIFAQGGPKAKHKKVQKKETAVITYICPMDFDVTSTKPGRCSKCGMELVKAKPVVYTCPMHPKVASSKPGKCPTCTMNLEVKKNEPTSLKTNL